MFGLGKSKTQDVRLTEKEIENLKKNMNKSEIKGFTKKQKQAQNDCFWDAMILGEMLDEEGEYFG